MRLRIAGVATMCICAPLCSTLAIVWGGDSPGSASFGSGPGTDLGLALAVASSYRSRPVLEGTLAVGEVSLSGELRRVSRVEARVREAAALGFKRAAVPAMQAADARTDGIEVVPVATVREAIAELLGAKVEVRPPDARAGGAPRRDAPAKESSRS